MRCQLWEQADAKLFGDSALSQVVGISLTKFARVSVFQSEPLVASITGFHLTCLGTSMEAAVMPRGRQSVDIISVGSIETAMAILA
jgi:hypothetical protein